jgi:hypothetical protein
MTSYRYPYNVLDEQVINTVFRYRPYTSIPVVDALLLIFEYL